MSDRLSGDDYLWDRSGAADPDVARLEELLAPVAHDAPLDELRLRRRRSRWPLIGAAVAALTIAAIALVVLRPRGGAAPCTGTSGFAFTSHGGTASCSGHELARGVLPVGGSLDTGAHDAELAIADIGHADLGPHTQVRLSRTGADRHELALERGRMHARVNAPPRLFAVTTKGADVVDLGCEYTIEVDDHGAGHIDVQTGKVELATRAGAIVVAPAGTHAAILAGRQPGLPLSAHASAELIATVHAYESGDAHAVADLLAAARDGDAITVIALATIDEPSRTQSLARLAELAPPPSGVTAESAARDPSALAAWRDAIVSRYLIQRWPGGGGKTKKSF